MSLFQRQIIATLLLSCCAFVARGETLRLVTEAWAPYIYEENGQATGLDYEVTREVLSRLGLKLDLQFLPWKRCLLALEHGHADGILDIFHIPEREAGMLFVEEPLSDIELVLFYARNRPYPYDKLEDLRDLVVGISPGYWYNDETFRTSPLFSREEAPTHEANMGKLIRHRVDLVVNDRRAGLYLSAQMGIATQIDYNRKIIGRDHLHLALRHDPALQQLATDFTRELRLFKRGPTYALLQERYAKPHEFKP